MPGVHFCGYCDLEQKLSFPSKVLLYKHLKLRHPRETEVELGGNVERKKTLFRVQSAKKFNTCSICATSNEKQSAHFRSLNDLATHLYSAHSKDDADQEYSRLTGKVISCEICGKFIQSEKLLRLHKRKFHDGQGIETKPQDCHIVCREEGCNWNGSGRTVFDLRTHLSQEHNLEFEVIQDRKFHSPEAEGVQFDINQSASQFEHWCYWIENREDQPGRLIRHRGNKKLKGGYMVRMVKQCNRTGAAREKSESDRVRNRRKRGSQKINGTCTLYIQAVHNLMDDSVLVEDACLTHYGHDFDLRHITLSNFDRDAIAAKALMGVPLEKIQEDYKKSAPLSRGTIRNVMKSKNIRIERSPKAIQRKRNCRDVTFQSSPSQKRYQLSANYEDRLAVQAIQDGRGNFTESSIDVDFEHEVEGEVLVESAFEQRSPLRAYRMPSPLRSGQLQYMNQPSSSRENVVHFVPPLDESRRHIGYTEVSRTNPGLPRGIRVFQHQPTIRLNEDGALVDTSSQGPIIIDEGAEEVVVGTISDEGPPIIDHQEGGGEAFEFLEDELQSKLSFLQKLTLQLTLEVEQIMSGGKASNAEAISAACELTGKAARALNMHPASFNSTDPGERMTIMERVLGKKNVTEKERKSGGGGGPSDHDYLLPGGGISNEPKY